ncbi:MAG: hypothetical protein EA397_12725 [Deltaproteobacteria bacterium]|nr:MAG: hypothetical protein EA397_12725 [Deltaproteobacteria bacterium]
MRPLWLLAALTALSLIPFALTTALGWSGHLDALSGTTPPTLTGLGMGTTYLLARLSALLLTPLLGLTTLSYAIAQTVRHLFGSVPRRGSPRSTAVRSGPPRASPPPLAPKTTELP